jgi:hypothetical protein
LKESNRRHEDEVAGILSTVQMTQRGIRNQNLPDCHEVAIECDRLLALSYCLLDDQNEAREHHKRCLQKIAQIGKLFDPVASGVQHLEYSKVLDQPESAQERVKGIAALTECLGGGHPWILSLYHSTENTTNSNVAASIAQRNIKRPRLRQE